MMRYAFASLLPSHHFLKEDAYARPSISTAPCIVHLFYKLSYKSFKSLNPGSAFCRALTAQRGGMICWHGKAIIRRSGSRSAFSKPMLLQKVPDCSRFCSGSPKIAVRQSGFEHGLSGPCGVSAAMPAEEYRLLREWSSLSIDFLVGAHNNLMLNLCYLIDCKY